MVNPLQPPEMSLLLATSACAGSSGRFFMIGGFGCTLYVENDFNDIRDKSDLGMGGGSTPSTTRVNHTLEAGELYPAV
ncbi:hypothetical protein J1614_003259 [Plenodomus biglobosus]|nr:hypothetical protein J1614_003259 [Plenodomus biglobosus]